MTKEQLIQRLGITENQYYGIDIIEGYVDLNDLTSIPEGFNPTLVKRIYLNRNISVPEIFNPTVIRSSLLNGITFTECFDPIFD